MTHRAGERLFDAIGQLPEKMLLEAQQDGLTESQAQDRGLHEADSSQSSDIQQENSRLEAKRLKKQRRKQKRNNWVKLLGASAKYIPVAASLCLVFAGAYYVIGSMNKADHSTNFSMMKDGAAGGAGQDAAGDVEDTKESTESGGAQESAGVTGEEPAVDDGGMAGGAVQEGIDVTNPLDKQLPVRYDAYIGPALTMTATGDTQKIKTVRKLESVVTQELLDGVTQPLVQLADTYWIKNTSNEEQAVQLVYPFVTTLNQAFDMQEEILTAKGQEDLRVTYGIGGSVSADRHQNPQVKASVEDYGQLLDEEEDYQERALQKAADWEREVRVYSFRDISIQEDADFDGHTGVIGVTVQGAHADVLTYGFDHMQEKEDGTANYCFFPPQEQSAVYMIVTGQMDGEPKLGYYTNLDCVESIEGITCNMQEQKMSYSDALHLCSTAAAKQAEQTYGQEAYGRQMPDYLNADTVYQALTAIGEEDAFFDTLVQLYHGTELQEICEKMLSETRIVYALAAVMIPAKQVLQVTAHTQKLQNNGRYTLMADEAELNGEGYTYDLLLSAGSHLNIAKTAFKITMPKEWRISDSNMKLKRKKSLWKAVLRDGEYYFTLTR